MMRQMFARTHLLTLGLAALLSIPSFAYADSVGAAVRDAVGSNPLIGESAANRRAIENEVDQARGLFLPRLDLEGSVAKQWTDRSSLADSDNREVRAPRTISVVATQTLFDGFFRANEVYRQFARVRGAAARVLERSEVVALDAIEAYVDLVRHYTVLGLADQNIAAHRKIVGRIADLAESGTATQGDVFQAQERLAAAEAVRTDVLRSIGEVQARFKRVVGRTPGKVGRLSPPKTGVQSVGGALQLARANHPSLLAAAADIETAEAEFDQTKSLFLPRLALEGRASAGQDLGGTPGRSNELSARITMSWNLFNGGIDKARKRERRERLTETQIRQDRLRRDVDEAAERSWSDVQTNDLRLGVLRREVAKAQLVRTAYVEEFDAGLRSLLDLLDSENAVFNVKAQLVSSEAIAVFSRYQLIAATGALLQKFGIEPPPASVVDGTDRRYRPIGTFTLEPLRKW